MRFLICVLDHKTGSATPEEMKAIDAFNASLREDGHWVFAGGLEEPGSWRLVDNRGQAGVVTASPPSPEYVSGLWVVTAPDAETAVDLARRASAACNRRVELRPFH